MPHEKKGPPPLLLVPLLVVSLLVSCAAPRDGAGTNAEHESAPHESSAPPSSTATSTTTTATSTTQSTSTRATTGEYRPGLDAHLFLPSTGSTVPLVVMIPGGGWRTADPEGFDGLAEHLANAGSVALTVEVSAAIDDVYYPTPVEDVLCAVAYGVSRTAEAGFTSGPVVVLGHSSGAHLASLAASITQGRLPDCPEPPTTVDALVGLAGVYDVSRLPALALLLFGVPPDDDPEMWEEGNPLRSASARPEVPVLLLHGDEDRLVPPFFSRDFAAALEEGGHATTVSVIEGAGHREIFAADVSGDIIADWVAGLTPSD